MFINEEACLSALKLSLWGKKCHFRQEEEATREKELKESWPSQGWDPVFEG